VLAAGVGSIAGGAGYLVAHASTKALLFLVAGAWLAALGTKQLSALRGAARRWPLVGVLFTVGTLSLAGVAPLSLWALKDELLAVALKTNPVLYIVGLTAAALSAIYSGKVLFLVWGRADAATEAGYDAEQPGTRRIGRWERIPLIALAAGAALLGILALPPVSQPLKTMLGETGTATPGMLELVGSAVLALAVLALVAFGLRRGLPQPAWAANWLGLEKAVHLVVVRPTLALSESLARFDDGILDRGLHRLALPAHVGSGGSTTSGSTPLSRRRREPALSRVRARRAPTTGASMAPSRASRGSCDASARWRGAPRPARSTSTTPRSRSPSRPSSS